MKWKFLTTIALLIAAAGTASAQDYGPHWGSGPQARAYYGTPYEAQYRKGGGQYGYGPAYSYARQAPSHYCWR